VNHIKEQVSFWLKSAAYDWRVTKQLFEKKSYAHSLFFAHLVLEKQLKALFVPIVRKNVFSTNATVHYMMECTWITKPCPPHEFSLLK